MKLNGKSVVLKAGEKTREVQDWRVLKERASKSVYWA